jgi:RNA polymerase sigma-70 factor (ECF subfamily)
LNNEESKYRVTPEEKALIRKAAKGDCAAFEQLYKSNFRFILFYTRRFFADENGYEDIVQEVVLDMFNGIGGLKEPHRFRSWLYVLIKNVCIKHIQREQRRESGWDGDDDAVLQIEERRREYIPEDNFEKSEVDEFLADAVAALSPGYQNVVRMYYYDEKNYQEIADELGISVKTVGSNLTKAKRMLKEMLAKNKKNMDSMISHALFVAGANASLAGVDASHLMHLCDAKIAAAVAAHAGVAGGAGAGTSAAVSTGAGIAGGAAVSVKLVVAVIACVAVATGGGAAVVQIAQESAALPEPVTVVVEIDAGAADVANPEANIVVAGRNPNLPEGVNPSSAELVTDKGVAAEWQVLSEGGAVAASGAGSHIGAELETLVPGSYTIVWQINGEAWTATAKRSIKIIETP